MLVLVLVLLVLMPLVLVLVLVLLVLLPYCCCATALLLAACCRFFRLRLLTQSFRPLLPLCRSRRTCRSLLPTRQHPQKGWWALTRWVPI